MKCPKCECEMWKFLLCHDPDIWHCRKCGHEEKVKPDEKWDESRMVYCTGGKYPQPKKPEFSPRVGDLVGKYGCAHYKDDPCACRCHIRKSRGKGEK